VYSYCLNQPVSNYDPLGTLSTGTDENNDDFKVVGAGFQIDLSASLGFVSGGGGAEVILFWDTEECADKGGPIVAVYLYGDAALLADTDAILKQIGPITELLTESADLLMMDGANAIESVLANSKIDFSYTVSGFAVTGNRHFKNTMDYTKAFETTSVALGSIKGGKAWSDCCITYSLGYTNSFVPLRFNIKLPTISRGKAYYVQVYSSNQ
jgi:hypothetical protein